MAANSVKKMAAIMAMPPDRPSMLSSRFMALVMPITQTSVMHDVQPVAKELDLNAAVDQDQRCGDLADQFDIAAQSPAVIDQPHEADHRGADEDADDLVDIAPIAEEEQGHNEGDVDGGAAQQRHGVGCGSCALPALSTTPVRSATRRSSGVLLKARINALIAIKK